METNSKVLKKVTTLLTPESVVISIVCDHGRCVVDLPVQFIDPQISLQFAGALASSPKLPRDADSENN